MNPGMATIIYQLRQRRIREESALCWHEQKHDKLLKQLAIHYPEIKVYSYQKYFTSKK